MDLHVFVSLGDLTPDDVDVQVVHGRVKGEDQLVDTTTMPLALAETYEGGRHRFDGHLQLVARGLLRLHRPDPAEEPVPRLPCRAGVGGAGVGGRCDVAGQTSGRCACRRTTDDPLGDGQVDDPAEPLAVWGCSPRPRPARRRRTGSTSPGTCTSSISGVDHPGRDREERDRVEADHPLPVAGDVAGADRPPGDRPRRPATAPPG